VDAYEAHTLSLARAQTGLMAAISPLTFSPWVDHNGARALGCYTCAHWHGEFARGGSGHVLCRRGDPFLFVPGIAKNGCVFWMRATGGDDQCSE